MTTRLHLIPLSCALAVAYASSCGSDGATETSSLRRIDDPCSSPQECMSDGANCSPQSDGVMRCEASCLGDKSCGEDATCLFKTGASVGECFRTCTTPAECAGDGWRCKNLVAGSPQGYCLPPCHLSRCTATTFSYNCGSGSYTTDFLRIGDHSTTSVSYANGNTVTCEATAGHGSCTDNTGASCSF